MVWSACRNPGFRCSATTGLPPAVTVAVSVTTLPDVTVVAGSPLEISDRVVLVGALAAPACTVPAPAVKHTIGKR